MSTRISIAWMAAVAAAIAGAAFASLVAADTPPVPDFYWPYGTVQIDGANIVPAVQPVIAFVNGQSCGQGAQTQLVEDDEDSDTPPVVDSGKTVYVINVLADGTAPGQRPGCGTPGLPVTLYFPVIGRIAGEQPLFKAGGERVNLDLDVALVYRLRTPLVAADSAP